MEMIFSRNQLSHIQLGIRWEKESKERWKLEIWDKSCFPYIIKKLKCLYRKMDENCWKVVTVSMTSFIMGIDNIKTLISLMLLLLLLSSVMSPIFASQYISMTSKSIHLWNKLTSYISTNSCDNEIIQWEDMKLLGSIFNASVSKK